MKKIGDYKMTDHKISAGTFTNIYTGFGNNGRNVAIKEIIQSQFVPSPIDEKNKLIVDIQNCQGKNIAQLHQVVDDYPYFYIVMELGETTLDKILTKNQNYPYPDREALYAWTQILMGYKFFYKNGVIY